MNIRARLPLAILTLSLAGYFVAGCTAPTSTQFELSVVIAGSGTGTVTAADSLINCQTGNEPTCSSQYDSGTDVTLTAAPGANSQFMGWSGACSASGTSTTCKVTMSQAQSVTAQFNIIKDPVQITIAGTGYGTVTSTPSGLDCGNYSGAPNQCSETVDQGGMVTLTAAAQTNSQFVSWSGCATSSGTECTVDVSQAESVTATFNVIVQTAPLVSSMNLGAISQGEIGTVGMNYYIATQGVFPSASGAQPTNGAPYVGQIMLFAGNVLPGGWALCDGSLLNISTNTALFSLLGTNYGGNGTTTFGLPNLSGRAPMGAGTLAGASNPPSVGVAGIPVITSATLGAYAQGQVGVQGIGFYIALNGVFPSNGGSDNTTGQPYVGQLMMFAGNFAPGGWALCNGALLNISTNTALFSLLGTNYGGNGTTTFGLPNLSGRVPMGVGSLSNPVTPPAGSAQVPLVTSITEGATAQGQVGVQGINYYMAQYGVYPSTGGSENTGPAYVGSVMMFAGNFAPTGWVACDGSLQNISTNTVLYSILTTSYGGNGTTTFGYPDLRARVPVGVGSQ